MAYQTQQEEFWAGDFGNQYIKRNDDAQILASSIAMFCEILKKTQKVHSVIEFGANIGVNLEALNKLIPNCSFAAIEINQRAAEVLQGKGWIKVYQESILECIPAEKYDLTMIRGVLIHINPEALEQVYKKLYDCSNRYILIAEYYNPSPVAIDYRGHSERLFKRDFAGEILDKYSDIKLVDYGFIYHRDNNFFQDDITWFLLEKMSR